jgi:WD40 repeat protein
MPQSSAIARQWNLNLPVTALAINRNGDVLAAAMGDGSLRLLPATAHAAEAAPREVKLHNGVSLSLQADADDQSFLSGGDDGKIFIVDPNGAPTLIAEHKNQWVDHVASSVEGLRAYTLGKNLYRLDDEGKAQGAPLPHPSSIGGLQFSPNGKRIAASHYNGVTLWWTGAKESSPTTLTWKGSHLNLCWSPDGKNLMTAMQDNAVHGWRFADMKEMSMEGYAGKIRSMEFTAKGKYLATSGGTMAVCWPFYGGGPWGKTPVTLGSGESRIVTRVAAHPKDELVAAGYDDGMVLLGPLDGRTEMLIHPPVATTGASVVGLAWNGMGDCLFAALGNGILLLFTIDSVKRSVRG